MLSRITLPAALAATLALGAMPATAATPPRETPADLSAFRTAKVSLEQAVKTVRDQTDGVVISAVFHAAPELGFKPPYAAASVIGQMEGYLVTYIAAGAVSVCFVDPQTGQTAQAETTSTANYNPEGTSLRRYLALEHTPTALPQAIALVQQRTGARAIDAAPERLDGTLGYRVDVMRHGAISEEWVNPGSGQVSSAS